MQVVEGQEVYNEYLVLNTIAVSANAHAPMHLTGSCIQIHLALAHPALLIYRANI